jgi:hypothetical protein
VIAALAALVEFGVSSAKKISSSKASSKLTRDYLTNPTTGIQTYAGNALASIISQYEQIKAAGQLDRDTILATIEAIERVRQAFEAHVRSLGAVFMAQAGTGGINTINSVAARLIADKNNELASYPPGILGGGGGGGGAGGVTTVGSDVAGTVAIGGTQFSVVFLLIVFALGAWLYLRK